jgi:hypothetical protein
MALKPGDIIRTEAGEVGKVVHIDRLTVFVTFTGPSALDRMEAFLESQLTKLDEPNVGESLRDSHG